MRELIEEGIATGSFPPGMRLDEMELAERFNVSRTPLREALFQEYVRLLGRRGCDEMLARVGRAPGEAAR